MRDKETIEKIVEENMNLVPFLVNRYFYGDIKRDNSLKDEYISEGNIGLFIAAQKFDESLGKFSTYASTWIISKIKTYKRDKSNLIRIPRDVIRMSTIYYKNQYEKTTEEIANENNLDLKELERFLVLSEMASIDYEVENEKSNNFGIIQTIQSEINIESQITDQISDEEKLDILFKVLNDKQIEVLNLVRNGIVNQTEIAKKTNISQVHVSRILLKLTKEIGPALDKYYNGHIKYEEFYSIAKRTQIKKVS